MAAGNENDLEPNMNRDVNLHGSSFHGTPSLLGDANDRALTDGGRTPRDVLPADLADFHNQFRGMMETWAAERAKSEEREGQTQAYCESLAFQIKGLQEENEQLRQALAEAGYSLDASGTPTRLSAAAHRTGLHENASADGSGGRQVQSSTTRATEGGGGAPWQCVYVGDTHTYPVQGIASSAEGGVATASWDGTVRLFRDQQQGGASWGQAWSTPPRTAKGMYSVAFRPTAGHSTSLLASACMDWSCYLFSTSDGSEVGRLAGHDGEVNALAFKPGSDGVLASVSDDKSCILWNVDTQKAMQRLVGVHTAEMYGCGFSPASRETLATVGFDRVAVVWDTRQGKHTEVVSGHADDVIGVDWSHDGVHLATGSDDGTAQVFDARKLSEPVWVLEHGEEVKRVAFAPDRDASGNVQLATSCSDKIARVWHLGQQRGAGGAEAKSDSLEGHGDAVFDVAWLAGETGMRLATASHDHTWRLWDPQSS